MINRLIIMNQTRQASLADMSQTSKASAKRASPTIVDIARATGVSTATVSNALSGRGRVSAKKVAEISSAAADIGYVPQHAARALRQGRASIIGLVVPNITNPIFTAMAQAIDECLHHRGLGVLLADSKNRRQGQDEAIRNLSAHGADALIVIPRHDTEVVSRGVPIVVIDVPGRADSAVCSNHHDGGRQIARHLLELGHARILIMAGPENSAVAGARVAGMREIFDARPHVVLEIRHSPYGPDAAEAILASQGSFDFTALAAVSDTLAIGALRYLISAGIRVPQDISVSGFDDTIWSRLSAPAMTSVRQNVAEIARAASAIAVGETSGGVTIPVDLVVRGSTGPAQQTTTNFNQGEYT
ncbi:hypothetical protein MNBD_ALPHA09-2109 [hydrothermal vent metagenome]|uniref:HTH lacI-type domain-containing protein n=1 Tax=hydrothermal vent metagenome TaxID=652676 RepID=A0A3B0TJA0_9ZZZZ